MIKCWAWHSPSLLLSLQTSERSKRKSKLSGVSNYQFTFVTFFLSLTEILDEKTLFLSKKQYVGHRLLLTGELQLRYRATISCAAPPPSPPNPGTSLAQARQYFLFVLRVDQGHLLLRQVYNPAGAGALCTGSDEGNHAEMVLRIP